MSDPAHLHDAHDARADRVFWIKSRALMARRLAVNLLTRQALQRYRRPQLSGEADLRVITAAIDGYRTRTRRYVQLLARPGRTTHCKIM